MAERAAIGPLVIVVGQPDPVGERILGGALEIDVDGQTDVVARLRKLAELPLAGDPPEGVDEDASLAANTAEIHVVGRLDAGLTDAVARRVALVGLGGELLGADLTDVAKELRGEGPARSRAGRSP